MPRLPRRRTKKTGLPPGTLVYEGEKRTDRVHITVIDYDEEHFEEKTVDSAEECFPFRDSSTVTWINVDGLHDTGLIEKLGRHFKIHPLALEDIVNPEQRPKMEEYDGFIFVTLRMLSYDGENDGIGGEQVSLVLGENFVISFQEREGDVFEPVRERIRGKKGRIVRQGPDYLAYALFDIVVDNYFDILEKVGDRVELIDTEVLESPSPSSLHGIQKMKREMIFLRKSVWPLREVISSLERTETALIGETTHVYLRDVYDHTIQVVETVESLRDVISGLLDLYMTSVSNRMNEVMKVLTIIATIFIPLTFIAGIYGMNFEHMPELGIRWAYPAVWGVMVLVALVMLSFFRRKKWL